MNFTLDLLVLISILTMVVLGLGVILGLMHIVNLAHTGLMAVGVYILLTASRMGISFWPGVVLAVVGTAVIGAVIEVLIVRKLYGRHIDDTIIATWGIALVVANLLIWIYGRETFAVSMPIEGGVTIAGVPYSAYRMLLVVAVVVLVVAMALLLRFSKVGLTVRMVMGNPALARAVGINTTKVQRVTFITGAALAGFAGALLGPTQAIVPNYALGLLPTAFMAVLMSGRNLPGLVTACIVLGSTQMLFSVYTNPVLAGVMVIVAAVVVLKIWPQGFVWRRS